MKKICILGLSLLIIMTAGVFTGCTNQGDTNQTGTTVSAADKTNDSDLEVVQGQDMSIEVDEADAEDPFAE